MKRIIVLGSIIISQIAYCSWPFQEQTESNEIISDQIVPEPSTNNEDDVSVDTSAIEESEDPARVQEMLKQIEEIINEHADVKESKSRSCVSLLKRTLEKCKRKFQKHSSQEKRKKQKINRKKNSKIYRQNKNRNRDE